MNKHLTRNWNKPRKADFDPLKSVFSYSFILYFYYIDILLFLLFLLFLFIIYIIFI